MSARSVLRTTVRTELQESTSGFWTDPELNMWLDEAHAELVQVTRQETTSTISLVANTETYSVPSDFLLARRIEIQVPGSGASNWMVLQPLSIDLRSPGDPLNTTTLTGTPTGWYVYGNKIVFVPIPSQSYTGTLYYFKNATAFTGDSDTPSYPEGVSQVTFDKALVDYTVSKALTKRQDGAYTVYAGRYNAVLADLIRIAEERGNANPTVVVNDWDFE